MKSPTQTIIELQQRDRLRTVSRKTTGEEWCVLVCVLVGGGGGGEGGGKGGGCEVGGKQVLLAQNLTLNSYAAPNYKYMFGPHRGPLYVKHDSECMYI